MPWKTSTAVTLDDVSTWISTHSLEHGETMNSVFVKIMAIGNGGYCHLQTDLQMTMMLSEISRSMMAIRSNFNMLGFKLTMPQKTATAVTLADVNTWISTQSCGIQQNDNFSFQIKSLNDGDKVHFNMLGIQTYDTIENVNCCYACRCQHLDINSILQHVAKR